MFGVTLVSFNRVPFEDSRSRSTHLPDSYSIERCLEEMPESLIGRLFPRTTRPIRTLDRGPKSRVSPSRGPWTIISLRAKGSIFSEKEGGKVFEFEMLFRVNKPVKFELDSLIFSFFISSFSFLIYNLDLLFQTRKKYKTYISSKQKNLE